MYATTRSSSIKFGLNDISDLPKVEDLADVLGFDPPSLDTEPTAYAARLRLRLVVGRRLDGIGSGGGNERR